LRADSFFYSTGSNPSERIVGYYEAELPQSAFKGGAKNDLSCVDFFVVKIEGINHKQRRS